MKKSDTKPAGSNPPWPLSGRQVQTGPPPQLCYRPQHISPPREAGLRLSKTLWWSKEQEERDQHFLSTDCVSHTFLCFP